MSFDAWPSPESRRGPLPRIEDLPLREQGYDQEAVRRAFDDFYRHAAQLDASLNALEAVAAFQRDAAQLRSDLRALRGLGFPGGEPSWARAPAWASERAPSDVPATALRLAGEAALLIAVAVTAGVAHLRAWAIVALMAAAVAVVWLTEWLAARARTRVPATAYEPAAFSGYGALEAEPAGEPAPYVEAPALDPGVGWSAFAPAADEELEGEESARQVGEPLEETEEDAAPEPEAPEPEAPVAADAEPGPQDESGPSEAAADSPAAVEAAEAEPRSGRGWLRRRRDKEPAAAGDAATVPQPPTHVRVLTPTDDDAPWERGFDGEPAE